MKISKKTLLFVLIIVVIAVLSSVFWGYTRQTFIESDDAEPIENTALKEVLDQCNDITERAAAHLVAVVEFQKLEIIGRKARVFKMCVQDHGYIENQYWLSHSQPIAEKNAIDGNISVNEALENLRRTDMMVSTGVADKPVYWIKEEKVKLNRSS